MPLVFERTPKAKDRAWLQESVFGVLRVLPRLQVYLRLLLEKPLKSQQKIIEHVIMLGMFQSAFMRTSSHAAVSETVEAVKVLKAPQLSGLVNAILRRFEREKIVEHEITQAHAKVNLPKWLFRTLSEAYPENIDSLCEQMNAKAPLFLRINLMEIGLPDYCELLNKAQIAHEIHPPRTVLIKQNVEIPSLPLYESGGFSVQDYAAQKSADLLQVQPGEVVLDACAAPGGKTGAIIEACPALGHIYAMDTDEHRQSKTRENLKRLNHTKRLKARLTIVNGDASDPASFSSLPLFDKILLDAPCTATGIIRKHPDIKWHRKASDVEAICQLQQKILANCWAQLKPGGVLLYATCSILPQENSQQITAFLASHSDASLLAIQGHEHDQQVGWQILPGEQNMDGFFYARLIKSL